MKKVSAVLLAVALSACTTVQLNGRKVDMAAAAHDYVMIAAHYIQLGNYDQAQVNLQKALDRNPNSAEAYSYLGILLERQNDFAGAEKDYRKSIELGGDSSQAHNNFGSFLFRRQHYEEAASEFTKASADINYDKRDQAFENLGRAQIKLGDYDSAESSFTHALLLNPNLPGATSELADIQFHKGNVDRAYALYQKYLNLTQGQSQTARTLWLGIRLERVHGNRDALASYELALRQLYPNSDEYQAYQKSLGQGM